MSVGGKLPCCSVVWSQVRLVLDGFAQYRMWRPSQPPSPPGIECSDMTGNDSPHHADTFHILTRYFGKRQANSVDLALIMHESFFKKFALLSRVSMSPKSQNLSSFCVTFPVQS